MEYESPWILHGDFLFEVPEGCECFVYLITNKVSGRKYVGKKTFWSVTSKVVKGRKNRKRTKKESDWKKYFGSNKELQEDVKALGKENFTREILMVCERKGDASYHEARLQFELGVLLSDEYYNSHIMAHIHKKHLRKKTDEEL